MISPLRSGSAWLRRLQANQRVTAALARGAATSASRLLAPTDPSTWEFTGFSQNGEDGIIDYLTRCLLAPNRYFIELGSSSGVENNTSWLAIARRFSGLMVEADGAAYEYARDVIASWSINVTVLHLAVHDDTVGRVLASAVHSDPDVFSVDIDSIDYYVTTRLLHAGLRPKILAVEYNSAFGPTRPCTVKYMFPWTWDVPAGQNLYYGASISAWRQLLASFGYRFLTVEQNGVNAFFVHPDAFPVDSLIGMRGIPYRENTFQFRRHRGVTWQGQFDLISHLDIVDV